MLEGVLDECSDVDPSLWPNSDAEFRPAL
jgi:hypothetical protein